MQIIAHRGASFDAPENTVTSARLAWSQHADGVELDLHLSKEGQLIVMHDPNTRRITGHDQTIATMTLVEIKKLDAGRWKGAQFSGERIPTLDELLETLPSHRRLFIEIKTGPEIIPPLVAALQRHRAKACQAILISFNLESLIAAKKEIPDVPGFWLLGRPAERKAATSPSLEELRQDCRTAHAHGGLPESALRPTLSWSTAVKICHQAGLDGLNLDCRWRITPGEMTQLSRAGLKLYVWTVDNSAAARRWMDLGAEGITTNRPGWLRNMLTTGG